MLILLPELIVIAAAVLVLLADLFAPAELPVAQKQGRLLQLALFGAAAAAIALIAAVPDRGVLFGGRFAMDPLAWWLKLTLLVSATLTLGLCQPALQGTRGRAATLQSGGEFLTILLFNLCGMLLLPSCRDAVTLYVALETATIPLFLLVAWRRDAAGSEAGLRYVVVGALASALLLYGLGILYGLTGTMDLAAIGKGLVAGRAAWFGIALVLAGLGFKLALAPMHTWAADVYAGAPAPVAAWLSAGSKIAGAAALLVLAFRSFGAFLPGWTLPIAILATLTMTAGNLAAVVQERLLRFMAFSAISQAGYLLLGLLGGTAAGAAALVYYLLVYAVTNLLVFAVIAARRHHTGSDRLDSFAGLGRTQPAVALAMMLGLFGLAGIPPLAGFVGKFFLFAAAAQAGLNWLVAVAAVNSTISLYYYLRLVRQMYIEPPPDGEQPMELGGLGGAAIGLATVASALLGVVPWCYESIRQGALHWL